MSLKAMSSSPDESAHVRGYAGTPLHLKTLDILGQTKSFHRLTSTDLDKYCDLAKTHYNCVTIEEVSNFLAARYKWDIDSRKEDLLASWEKINGEDGIDDKDGKSTSKLGGNVTTKATAAVTRSPQKKKAQNLSNPKIVERRTSELNTDTKTDLAHSSDNSSSGAMVPVVLKNGATERPILLCQLADQALQFSGDSGAVGRLFSGADSLRLDLKGRQYAGQLTSGPTVMILNFAPPVGAGAGVSASARAEFITNEFVDLQFQKDLQGNLPGIYTGEDAAAATGFGRAEFSGNQSDSGEEAQEGLKGRGGKGGKRGKKIASNVGGTGSNVKLDGERDATVGVKISTITQRKRKTGGASGKKSSSSKKAKK